ncbi:MAG: hypothetical protein ACK5AZ_13800 [Bryobacteraceae bacterium]
MSSLSSTVLRRSAAALGAGVLLTVPLESAAQELLAQAPAPGYSRPGAQDFRRSLKIDLPKDSPVALVSADWGESRAAARGGAIMLDLHTALSLRNASTRRIRGVTLLVTAQEMTPGGKASVTVPSLDVQPNEVFPVRIDLRLLRPLQTGSEPLVRVQLDGVLFDDLSFYGPNRLNSRRALTVWEMEARRDRRYFQALLESEGDEGLRREMIASVARQSERPRIDVQVARGRATNQEADRTVQFAFLQFPEAPVELLDGAAQIAGNEARSPHFQVRNRSGRAIRHLELGWIVTDRRGRDFHAGSVPADLTLGPGEQSQVVPQSGLRLSQRPGLPVSIEGMTGFLSSVEFSDGSVWIPTRRLLAEPRLQRALAPSAEEQRLTGIYVKKGLAAVIEELRRLN